MIHAREDYNRFQDPINKIGEDEPVMLFRAQDKYFIDVLEYYKQIVASEDIKEKIQNHIDLSIVWREENNVKEPDL